MIDRYPLARQVFHQGDPQQLVGHKVHWAVVELPCLQSADIVTISLGLHEHGRLNQ